MWKVVANDNGVLKSALVHDIPKMSPIYKLGEWVYPNIPYTKLFVFNDLDEAIKFSNTISNKSFNYYQLKIFECSVLNPEYTYDKFIKYKGVIEELAYDSASLYMLTNAIRDTAYGKPSYSHTVYVDAVKLLKEVKKF